MEFEFQQKAPFIDLKVKGEDQTLDLINDAFEQYLIELDKVVRSRRAKALLTQIISSEDDYNELTNGSDPQSERPLSEENSRRIYENERTMKKVSKVALQAINEHKKDLEDIKQLLENLKRNNGSLTRQAQECKSQGIKSMPQCLVYLNGEASE